MHLATCEVRMHDGSMVRLHKQDSDHDIEDRQSALQAIAHYESQGRCLRAFFTLIATAKSCTIS